MRWILFAVVFIADRRIDVHSLYGMSMTKKCSQGRRRGKVEYCSVNLQMKQIRFVLPTELEMTPFKLNEIFP